MANYGKYYIAVRLLLLKQYLEANSGRTRIVKRSELEQLLKEHDMPVEKKPLYQDFAALGMSAVYSWNTMFPRRAKDVVCLFSKADCSGKAKSALNEQQNKEKLLIPSRNTVIDYCQPDLLHLLPFGEANQGVASVEPSASRCPPDICIYMVQICPLTKKEKTILLDGLFFFGAASQI